MRSTSTTDRLHSGVCYQLIILPDIVYSSEFILSTFKTQSIKVTETLTNSGKGIFEMENVDEISSECEFVSENEATTNEKQKKRRKEKASN